THFGGVGIRAESTARSSTAGAGARTVEEVDRTRISRPGLDARRSRSGQSETPGGVSEDRLRTGRGERTSRARRGQQGPTPAAAARAGGELNSADGSSGSHHDPDGR